MSARVAFEILYREYYVRVFGLCRKLLNASALAEDATQETFMRAYRNFSRYDSSRPFWNWIATIASRICIDQIRARSQTEHLFGDEHDELESLAADQPHASTTIIEAQDKQALLAAISQLPDKYRIPLTLAYLQEMSYEQIADQLDVSQNHVGVLLLRAKQRLRATMTAPSTAGSNP